jgi:small GTP-binding protein
VASNNNHQEDEHKEKLKKDVFSSIFRKSERPRSLRELGTTTLRNLPSNIGMVQNFMKAVNWQQAQGEVVEGLSNTIVIVGQPNTGKSTLFNKLKGQAISPVSAQAGTTQTVVRTDFGPFILADTPGVPTSGHLPDVVEKALEQASVIVFLIDASKGLQTRDKELYEALKKKNKPIIIAVNKVDTLKGGEGGDQFATEAAVMLGVPGVIPISAKTGLNVAEELIPALIEASPEAALVIGRELPSFRHAAAQRIIRNATLVSLAAGLEPIPFVDIPILLGTQIRLVLRLAALYGEALETTDAKQHARELIATMLGGLGLRYVAEQAAKAVPFGGDFVAGIIAGAATWSIGEVAMEYYEGGKQINPRHLRQRYNELYHRFRKENTAEDLRRQTVDGSTSVGLLEEPGPKTTSKNT